MNCAVVARSVGTSGILTIRGKKYFLWRAVDQEGTVPDILVQNRRKKHAAKRFFRKLLMGLIYVPRVLITDILASYGAAKREILPGVEHRQHKRLTNRAENSHQPHPYAAARAENASVQIGRSCRAFFFPPLAPSPVTSSRDSIAWQQGSTMPHYPFYSTSGMK